MNTGEPTQGRSFSAAFQDELEELFRWRRDVRHFRTDAVPEADLQRMLHAASLAPSVGLSQPWRWVRVRSPERRAAVIANFEGANRRAAERYSDERLGLYRSLKLAGLKEAPEHLAVFCAADPKQGHGLGRQTMPEMLRYSVVTSVLALWLMGRSLGIGVGWVSILDPESLNETLEVPPEWCLVAYLCVGYPALDSATPELIKTGWEQREPLQVVER